MFFVTFLAGWPNRGLLPSPPSSSCQTLMSYCRRTLQCPTSSPGSGSLPQVSTKPWNPSYPTSTPHSILPHWRKLSRLVTENFKLRLCNGFQKKVSERAVFLKSPSFLCESGSWKCPFTRSEDDALMGWERHWKGLTWTRVQKFATHAWPRQIKSTQFNHFKDKLNSNYLFRKKERPLFRGFIILILILTKHFYEIISRKVHPIGSCQDQDRCEIPALKGNGHPLQ